MSKKSRAKVPEKTDYNQLLGNVRELLDKARRTAARSVNAILTATYWEIGRCIVVFEQAGQERAVYGAALLKQLSSDLTTQFGRGFSERNLQQMRLFYQNWPISQTVSAKSTEVLDIVEDSEKYEFVISNPDILLKLFPLSWSHYVRLMSVGALRHVRSTHLKLCAGAGLCGNLTAKLPRSSMNAHSCLGIRLQC